MEARYHQNKNCYSHYINPACIAAAVKVREESIDPFNFAQQRLIQEFLPRIVAGNVFLLSTLRSAFCKYLSQNGITSDSYSPQKLKLKLQEKAPQFCFISQPEHSDLVCSHSITVGDALRLALTLTNPVDSDEDEKDCVKFDSIPDNVNFASRRNNAGQRTTDRLLLLFSQNFSG